jgi:hypothetical protein
MPVLNVDLPEYSFRIPGIRKRLHAGSLWDIGRIFSVIQIWKGMKKPGLDDPAF